MVKNAVTTTYTYNNNNQLTTETAQGVTTTYAYDKNGNLLSKTGGGNSTTYPWDFRNLLLSVSSVESVVYEYNGAGNRISKTQAGVQTKYINDVAYSLVQVLMETDNAGEKKAVYEYGNDLISMNTGQISYYHYDGLGSTRQLTDSAGDAIASYTYDSFGNVIAQSAGGMASKTEKENETTNKSGLSLFAFLGLGLGVVTIRNRKNGLIVLLTILMIADPIPNSMATEVDVTGNPYGFTGQQQFGEADILVFLRARYYNPSIGRFISRDRILAPMKAGDNFVWFLPYLMDIPQSSNSYVYVQNNPVNYVDPSGEVYTLTIVVIGITIVATALTLFRFQRCAHWTNVFAEELQRAMDRNIIRGIDCPDTRRAWREATRTRAFKKMQSWCAGLFMADLPTSSG